MHILNKVKRIIPGTLLLAAFTMFYCMQQDGDDNVLDWIDFDEIPPVVTLLGDNPYSILVNSSYIEQGATAYDSVDGDCTDSIAIDNSDIDTSTIGTYQVVYTVSDYAGNVAMTKRNVIVLSNIDTVPPVITLVGPSHMNLTVGDQYNEPGATAEDVVDGNLSDSIIIDASTVDTSKVGTYLVSYTVSDAAGNEATKNRTVNVNPENYVDTIPPLITLIGNNPDTGYADVTYIDPGATAIDNHDDNTEITAKISVTGNVIISTMGIYELKYNVTDSAGNAAVEVTRSVLVVDTTPPVITLSGPNPINLLVGFTYTEYGASATDNIDGDLTSDIDTNNDSVNTSVTGSYRVHYTVSDASDNTAREIRIVNIGDVTDTIPPVITILGGNPMNLKVGYTYNEPGATALDDVDGNITSDIAITGSVNTSTVGTYIIRYNVSDREGNAADQKSRTVNVTSGNDVTKPVITLTGVNPYTMYIGDTYSEPGFSANDNVDGDITAKVQTTNNINNSTAGSYWVRYNVSDNAGNAADQKERTVVVNELSSDLIWEDFEVGENFQTKLAMDNFTTNDGLWYGYDDNTDGGESTINPDPAVDTSFLQIVQTGNGYNSSKGLKVTFTLKKGATFLYPFSAFGFSIKVTDAYYNMSKMQEFKFRVKGSGQMRIQFETKMVKEWPNAEERWGHFGKLFVLKADWTEITLTPSDITPSLYSEQANQLKKWTDPDASDKVTSVVFYTNGVDGSVIEFYLDEIKTTGLTVQDIVSENKNSSYIIQCGK